MTDRAVTIMDAANAILKLGGTIIPPMGARFVERESYVFAGVVEWNSGRQQIVIKTEKLWGAVAVWTADVFGPPSRTAHGKPRKTLVTSPLPWENVAILYLPDDVPNLGEWPRSLTQDK